MPPWVVPIAIGMLGWLWLYNGYFGIIAGVGMRTGILDGPFGFLAYKETRGHSHSFAQNRTMALLKLTNLRA